MLISGAAPPCLLSGTSCWNSLATQMSWCTHLMRTFPLLLDPKRYVCRSEIEMLEFFWNNLHFDCKQYQKTSKAETWKRSFSTQSRFEEEQTSAPRPCGLAQKLIQPFSVNSPFHWLVSSNLFPLPILRTKVGRFRKTKTLWLSSIVVVFEIKHLLKVDPVASQHQSHNANERVGCQGITILLYFVDENTLMWHDLSTSSSLEAVATLEGYF